MKLRMGCYAWMTVLLIIIVGTGVWTVVGFARIQARLGNDNGLAMAAVPTTAQRLGAVRELEGSVFEQERILFRLTAGNAGSTATTELRRTRNAIAAHIISLQGAALDPDARPILDNLMQAWEKYRTDLDTVLDNWSDASAADALVLLQRAWTLRRAVSLLGPVQQKSAARQREDVRSLSRSNALAAAMLTTISVLALLWLAQHLSETVFRPLQRIGRFIDRTALGELHLRLSTHKTDHLASLILSCNRLVANLQQLTAESRRRIDTERQLAVALIESFPTPTLAMSGGNNVILANASARVVLSGPQGGEALNSINETLRHGDDQFEAGGIPYALTRVPTTASRGFVGMLLHFQARPELDPGTTPDAGSA